MTPTPIAMSDTETDGATGRAQAEQATGASSDAPGAAGAPAWQGPRPGMVTDAVRAVELEPGDGERALDEMRAAGVALA